MNGLIDESPEGYRKGKKKAIALLVLTAAGAAIKLIFASLVIFAGIRHDRLGHISENALFVLVAIVLIALCGVVNIAGSVAMLRRQSQGIYVYLTGQGITLVMVNWAMLTLKYRLQAPEQLFLLAVNFVIAVFIVLYLGNRKYYHVSENKQERND